MVTKNLARFLLVAVFAAASLLAAAGGSGGAREDWQRMSPEERRQMRVHIRWHWAQMSPEERAAHMAARRDWMRERLSRMSPEERERMREQLRRHRHRHEEEGRVESAPWFSSPSKPPLAAFPPRSGLTGGSSKRAEDVPNGGSERMLPWVDELLAEAGLGLRLIEGIAFGAGPGDSMRP